MSELKPHRRLGLTRPTLPVTTDDNASTRTALSDELLAPSNFSGNDESATPNQSGHGKSRSADSAPKPPLEKPQAKTKTAARVQSQSGEESAASAGNVVRVMAYLSEEEADLLDSLWLSFRRHEKRPSKSDILRAALTTAALDQEKLTVAMSQQHNGTISRQRSSKIK